MGMDFTYGGSMSYPRFDSEVYEIVKVFGGEKTEHLKERERTENERPCGYWFGSMSSDRSKEPKYVFPEGTNEVLVRWFNNLYSDFTYEETLVVFEEFKKHPEIEEISSQIWRELEACIEYEDGWYIY